MCGPLAALLLAMTAGSSEPVVRERAAIPERGSLDCERTDPCDYVLPAAVRFERGEGRPYAVGYGPPTALEPQGPVVGWVVLSDDVVDVKGYSGKPLSTLVGLDPEGHISGARVVHHAEPILLVGIPVQKLHDFVDAYRGLRVDATVVVGRGDGGDKAIDAVSGATVTVLAENQTVLGTARRLAQEVGVLERHTTRPGSFVIDEPPWTWSHLVEAGALGHLVVGSEQMGGSGGAPVFDVWFGLADAPHVGIPLLGEHAWRSAVARLAPDEHLFVLYNGGETSIRGSAFVRGGVFDRFRIEQGLSVGTFRDLDYENVGPPQVEGAPPLQEGGLFVARGGVIDPGEPFDLVVLASAYDTEHGAFNRDFRSFKVSWQAPPSVYRVEGLSAAWRVVAEAWQRKPGRTAFVGAWLLGMVALFSVGRRWLTAGLTRLTRLHVFVMAVSFLVLGLGLRAQPSVTQLLTLLDGVHGAWRWELFLSEPAIFLSWIFIAGILLVWGRGVFCGWTCPFGALTELSFKLRERLGMPGWEVPEPWHHRLRWGRYVSLVVIVVLYLVDAQLGERAAELEPFKSTFFVAPWTRHPVIFGWWLLLVGSSFFVWRPFCQYLCPLGAALSVPSAFRISGPRRRDFCSKCKICTRTCEPRAIDSHGTIHGSDCLNCMECETNYYDDHTCPPLVKVRRDRERAGAVDLSGTFAQDASP